MNTVSIASLSHLAVGMLNDDHNLSTICERLRCRIHAQDIPTEQIERDICHILKIAFSTKSKDMAKAVEEWDKEI